MQTILLLGGYGFLGTNIIDFANRNLHDNYRFLVFDFYERHPLGLEFENVAKVYKGDYTNPEDIKIIFEENKVDYIFHFVSTTVPSSSNSNIPYDIESNLIPTIRLLELAKAYKVENFIYISSGGAIYGRSDDYFHKEEDILQPISSYGIIKLSVEKYLQLYHHLFGIPYLVLRLSNPYGLFHLSKKQGIINVALNKALENETLEIWGDGTNIKDYIYSEDVAKIIFALMAAQVRNKVLNVGSGVGHSTNEILEIVRKNIPHFSYQYKAAKAFDVPKVVLNTDKLRGIINFELITLETGIKKTLAWAKAFHKNQNSQ